jgi:hypothetical protein
VVGGGAAEAEVTVWGDEEVAAAPAPGGSDDADATAPNGPALQPASPFEGTVTLRVRAFLLSGGFPLSISGGDREIEVDVNGDAPVSLGSFLITTGIYQGLRVVFTEIRADLTAGLGSGETTGGGVVTVDLGEEELLALEEDAQLLLRDDVRLEVTVELHAPIWLATVAALPSPRVVTAGAFLDAVSLQIRTE